MTARPTVSLVDRTSTLGLVVGLLLAVAVIVAAWLAATDALGRPSITVNDHTDNAVPLVDGQAPGLRVDA